MKVKKKKSPFSLDSTQNSGYNRPTIIFTKGIMAKFLWMYRIGVLSIDHIRLPSHILTSIFYSFLIEFSYSILYILQCSTTKCHHSEMNKIILITEYMGLSFMDLFGFQKMISKWCSKKACALGNTPIFWEIYVRTSSRQLDIPYGSFKHGNGAPSIEHPTRPRDACIRNCPIRHFPPCVTTTQRLRIQQDEDSTATPCPGTFPTMTGILQREGTILVLLASRYKETAFGHTSSGAILLSYSKWPLLHDGIASSRTRAFFCFH